MLLLLGLTLGALTSCQETGGVIPGFEPPEPRRTVLAAPTPPSPSHASSPSTATATPNSGESRRQANTSLAKNSIYAVDLGDAQVYCEVRVRSPQPPLQDAKLAAYGKKLVGCMVKTFAKPLAAQGIELSTPNVKTYRRTIKTPCGKTIYWPMRGDNSNEAYTFARLGYVGLVAHEFSHHMQAASGMLLEYSQRSHAADSRSERYQLSRRLELQAQCFEGIFLAVAAASIGLSSDDRYQLSVWHSYTGDEDPPESRKPDHGSSAAQIRWLKRGLDSADFGRCNTWTASKKSVK
jgi:uncharacterized protein